VGSEIIGIGKAMLEKGYSLEEIKNLITGFEINPEYVEIGNSRIKYWLDKISKGFDPLSKPKNSEDLKKVKKNFLSK